MVLFVLPLLPFDVLFVSSFVAVWCVVCFTLGCHLMCCLFHPLLLFGVLFVSPLVAT